MGGNSGHGEVPLDVQYRMLVEQVPAVTCICEFSEDAPFLYVSPQIEPLLGFPASQWIAEPDLWSERLHPDDRDRVLAEEQRTFHEVLPYENEFRIVAADGRVVWLWEKDTIVRDERGRPVCTHGVLVDVTELKRTREALSESESRVREERDRAQGYLDIAGTMIVVVGADERIGLVNRRACEVLGYREDELRGSDWFEIAVPESEREARREGFRAAMAGASEAEAEVESPVVSKTGGTRVIAWRNTVLRDADGRITGTLSSGEDITERRRAQQHVTYLAFHDQLTGLANRAMLAERLQVAVTRAARSGDSVGLLCLDVDDFKLVNDSLGHAVGDELLVAVAERLGRAKRHADVLARAGGDEFFLLMPAMPEAADGDAMTAARRLSGAFDRPFEVEGAELHVSASVGISLFPRDAGDADELLRHADTAMYQAKAAGRGSITLYAPEDQDPLERLSLTSRLRRSLDRNELCLHYQPIFSLQSGGPVGVEALLRWNDPATGLVPPGVFIPAAEHSGLIEPIGQWVMDELCRQAAEWHALGLDPRLSFNASPRELRRPEYAEHVAAALARHGVDPSQLIVEVTESAAMDECGPGPIERLHELGVGLAIDDFGEGFSSLSRLREMPVEQLKIDRSFMREVPESDKAGAVVTAIIQLADALGREVVAEGVETEEQRLFLADRGCPLAQGFHLARPLPPDEVTALLLRS